MYALEHFNICSRCFESVPPLGCCVFCNFSDAEEKSMREHEKGKNAEYQRIQEEVNREMKIFEAML